MPRDIDNIIDWLLHENLFLLLIIASALLPPLIRLIRFLVQKAAAAGQQEGRPQSGSSGAPRTWEREREREQEQERRRELARERERTGPTQARQPAPAKPPARPEPRARDIFREIFFGEEEEQRPQRHREERREPAGPPRERTAAEAPSAAPSVPATDLPLLPPPEERARGLAPLQMRDSDLEQEVELMSSEERGGRRPTITDLRRRAGSDLRFGVLMKEVLDPPFTLRQ